jgi:hypothetical protein
MSESSKLPCDVYFLLPILSVASGDALRIYYLRIYACMYKDCNRRFMDLSPVQIDIQRERCANNNIIQMTELPFHAYGTHNNQQKRKEAL